MARRTKGMHIPHQHRGGEEWRAIEGGAAGCDPEASEAAISRAKASIPRIRMRDVELRLLQRDGRPAANLAVEIVQTRNSFPVGDQLWELDRLYRFGQGGMDRAKYLELRHAELFNAATALCYWTERPRNDGPKTEDLQGDTITDGFAYCVDRARAAGMTVKGHPLFWSIDKCVPDWVKRYDYATQLKFAEVRVRNLVARFRGRVAIWDAVNEPLWEPAFKHLAQRHWPHLESAADMAEYIAMVLRWAREEDPDACLLINDYGLEQEKQAPVAKNGTRVTAALQRKRLLELVEELRRRGTPPDALGMQAHTGGWADHATQWAVYEELAQAGLPLHVTEFWASTRDMQTKKPIPEETLLELQAEYVANYLTCAFGHPAIEAFFFWGFDGVQWGEHSSHDLKPVYRRVQDLLHREWMTRLSARTDRNGVIRFRGFYGEYALRHEISRSVQHGVRFAVDKQAGMPLTIQLWC